MSEVIRELTETHVTQIRNGDYNLLPLLLSHPEVVGRASESVRKTLFVVLFSVIGDTRGMFTTGVKKESAAAMRILTNLIVSFQDTSASFKQMLRQVGKDEVRRLRLDRHLVSSKTDVGPSALEFIRVVILVLNVHPSEILEQDSTIQRVEEILGPQIAARSGGRSAAEGEEGTGRRRSHTQPPSSRPDAVAAAARSTRALPSKCKGDPRPPFNPLYSASGDGNPFPCQSPEPVVFFAKHFGIGCVPKIAKWTARAPPPSESLMNSVSGYKPSKQGAQAAELVGAQQQQQQQQQQSGQGATPPVTPRRHRGGNLSPEHSPQSAGSPGAPQFPSVVEAAPAATAAPAAAPAAATTSATASPGGGSSMISPPPSTTSVHFVLQPPLDPASPVAHLHTRYLAGEGRLVGWGSSKMGELGVGKQLGLTSHVTARTLPFSTPSPILSVAAGSQYSLFCTNSGAIYCCGAGEWGQLGLGDPSVALTDVVDDIPVQYTPVPIKGFKASDKIVRVSAGYAFAIAISHKGEMYLWGNNNHGQCSVGSKPTKQTLRLSQPVKIAMKSSRIVDAACGSFFVVALTDNHVVLSWGLVSLLGLGAEADVLGQIDSQWISKSLSKEKRNIAIHPCKVSSLDGKKIVKIAAGQWHVVAVGAEGQVYSWGIGHQGRLGHGSTSSESKPKRIGVLRDVPIAEAACGSFHTVLRAVDGSVYTCGDNASGQCGFIDPSVTSCQLPTKVPGFGPGEVHFAISVQCGREHTMVLTSGAEVLVFGTGIGTGMGLGARPKTHHPRCVMTSHIHLSLCAGVGHGFSLSIPRQMDCIPAGTQHVGDQKLTPIRFSEKSTAITHAALGASFSVLLSGDGSVSTFGNGDWGQLGIGQLNAHPELKVADGVPYIKTPQRVQGLSEHRIAAVSAGYAFVYAISENFQVFFWGNNNHCQGALGVDMRGYTKVEEPKEVVSLSNLEVVQIACGSFFVIALTLSGDVYGWGLLDCCGVTPTGDAAAVLTTSATAEKRSVAASPVKIPELSSIIAISTGQWHSVALSETGQLYSWGIGHQGRLGHGDTNNISRPTRIATDVLFVKIDCGSFSSAGISATGELYLWGDNESGQCGVTGATTLLAPTMAARNVSSVACGRQHTVIVTTSGSTKVSGIIQHEGNVQQYQTFAFPSCLFGLQFDTASKLAAVYHCHDVFSGPHHVMLLAERQRPAKEAVEYAAAELRVGMQRAGLKALASASATAPAAATASTSSPSVSSGSAGGGGSGQPQFPSSPQRQQQGQSPTQNDTGNRGQAQGRPRSRTTTTR